MTFTLINSISDPTMGINTLDGMFSTVLNYSKMADISKYLDSSQKLKRAGAMKINAQAKAYEESNQNYIPSLSLLYAGGIIGKVK